MNIGFFAMCIIPCVIILQCVMHLWSGRAHSHAFSMHVLVMITCNTAISEHSTDRKPTAVDLVWLTKTAMVCCRSHLAWGKLTVCGKRQSMERSHQPIHLCFSLPTSDRRISSQTCRCPVKQIYGLNGKSNWCKSTWHSSDRSYRMTKNSFWWPMSLLMSELHTWTEFWSCCYQGNWSLAVGLPDNWSLEKQDFLHNEVIKT